MTVREVLDTDLGSVVRLARREWPALGIGARPTARNFRRLLAQRQLIIVHLDSNDLLDACLGLHPVRTERGPGVTANLVIVDSQLGPTARVERLDRVVLFACDLMLQRGWDIIVSRHELGMPGADYATDLLGLKRDAAASNDDYDYRIGTVTEARSRILGRHPSWP